METIQKNEYSYLELDSNAIALQRKRMQVVSLHCMAKQITTAVTQPDLLYEPSCELSPQLLTLCGAISLKIVCCCFC